MNDITNLYRQVIMEHFKHPRNKGLKNDSTYVKLRLKNPSCGDDVTIQIKRTGDKIHDIRHDGSGCSICCASASVMTELLKDQEIDYIKESINTFYELVKGEDVVDPDRLEEAIAFSGVSLFPARIKCATLAWKALEALIDGTIGEENVKE